MDLWTRPTVTLQTRWYDPRADRFHKADSLAGSNHAAQLQSPLPGDAVPSTMIELNNKYVLDDRNPNSYSGILWLLGRYERALGPERPIFGKIRYMSSAVHCNHLPAKNPR